MKDELRATRDTIALGLFILFIAGAIAVVILGVVVLFSNAFS